MEPCEDWLDLVCALAGQAALWTWTNRKSYDALPVLQIERVINQGIYCSAISHFRCIDYGRKST